MKKEGKDSWMRPFGQTSLTSSFLIKSSDIAQQQKPAKQSISLSDFLDRKISRTNSKLIQEKHRPLLTIGSVIEESDANKSQKACSYAVNGAIFRTFSRSGIQSASEDGEPQLDFAQNKRKRKDQVGDYSGEVAGVKESKHFLVLGDDPRPKPKRRQIEIKEKPKFVYNHYENGRGRWDEDREGVDTDEVGCSDVWEGMGSATLGGLEWH